MINLHDENSKGTYLVLLLIDRNLALYFYSFGIEYIPQELFKKSKINKLFAIYLEYKIMSQLLINI